MLMYLLICSNSLIVQGKEVEERINLIEISHVETNGEAMTVYIDGNLAFVLDTTDYNPEGLIIIDISDPYNPEKLTSYYDGGLPYDILSKDSIAFVADGNDGVEIFNISDPTTPIKIANHNDGGMSTDLELVGDLLFVADWSDGLEVLNVSDPQNPVEIYNYWSYQFTCTHVSIKDTIACITDHKNSYTGIRLLNISNPLAITTLTTYSPSNIDFWDPKIYGDFIYSQNDNLQGEDVYILNISNPFIIQEINSFSIGHDTHSIFIQNNIAYLADFNEGLNVIDITDPLNPFLIGNYHDIDGNSKDVQVIDDLVFVADRGGGLEILQQTITTVTMNYYYLINVIFYLVSFASIRLFNKRTKRKFWKLNLSKLKKK